MRKEAPTSLGGEDVTPNALFGAHHYTDDFNEREVLTSQGWKEEGIAWYVLDSPKSFEDDANAFQDMIEETTISTF